MQLAQGLESLAASENISGVGADAMRAYIREVHVPIVQSMVVSLSTFQPAIGVYWNGYSQVDTGGSFRLVNDEFDAHLTQLDTGMGELRGFADELRSIAASASHLVSLGGAGARAADRTVSEFERARLIAKTQQETWVAYEATDPGFAQVKELLAELKNVVKNLGNLTVGQGRSYTSGSFNLTLGRLGELTGGMLEYCEANQQVASDGWEALFSGYVNDVEAEQERQRKEEALWGLLWDGLQIVGGAVVMAIGIVGTPFTGGVSLGLTVLGGSLVVGGVNSAINHASIATTGDGLNLIGMASEGVGQWYDVTVAQPAIASGDKGLQFLAGAGSGLGQVVSEAAQVNVVEIGTGIVTLATSEEARSQLWNQMTTIGGQVLAGDTFVMGQIAGNLVPLGAAAKIGTGARVGSVTEKVTSALVWGKGAVGSAKVVVANAAETVKHTLVATRDDLLNALGNAEKKLGEVGQNLRPAPALAGVGTLPPGTPLADALTRLFRTTDTPTTPRNTTGGSSGGTISAPRSDMVPTLRPGEFPRGGDLWRGQSEGGPGEWAPSPIRTGGREYQEFVTRMERGTEYSVNGVDFDGFDATRNVLIDAKDWRKYPPAGTEFWQKGVLKEIQGQLDAAGDTPIEWHFSSETAKRAVDQLLREAGLMDDIQTVYTPFDLL